VTTSQATDWGKVWKSAVANASAAVQVIKDGKAKADKFVASCTGKACHMITGNSRLPPNPVKARSFDRFTPARVDEIVGVVRRELEFQEEEESYF
jgi:hypothetical protein